MLTKQVKYQKVNQMLKGKIKRNLNLKLKKMNFDIFTIFYYYIYEICYNL